MQTLSPHRREFASGSLALDEFAVDGGYKQLTQDEVAEIFRQSL